MSFSSSMEASRKLRYLDRKCVYHVVRWSRYGPNRHEFRLLFPELYCFQKQQHIQLLLRSVSLVFTRIFKTKSISKLSTLSGMIAMPYVFLLKSTVSYSYSFIAIRGLSQARQSPRSILRVSANVP